jgi:ubiquinone/menaquinone biosynthesis C-methylase UbiE
MPHDHPQKDRGLPNLGGSSDVELARLTILERRKIEQIGGLFPERENDLEDFEHVLDIMSGTGTWSLSVAQRYPEIEVQGLERRSQLADYANMLAETRKLGNVSYTRLDNGPTRLDFADNSFDMVNVNDLFPILHPHEWALFFQECLRVTRPGGYIRLLEQEWGMTNSPAIEKLADLFLRSLKKAGLGLSPSGRYIGVLPRLSAFLKQAGWSNIQRRVIVDDYLTGAGAPTSPAQAVGLMANSMRDLTLLQHLATPAEYEALLAQAISELEQEDFCSLLLLMAFWARKPESQTSFAQTA